MKYLFIVACLFITLSCNNGKKISDNVFEIDYKNLEDITLSDYVNNVKVVRLETSADVLIGEIVKVQIFNHKIYVLDRISNALFIFTEEGKFVNLLGKIGQGPGEYATLFDFNVTNKGLYLLDFGRSILQYDFDCNFIRQINTDPAAGAFVMNDEYFWIFREPSLIPYKQILMIDKTGNFIRTFFPKEADDGSMNLASSNLFQKQESDIYFSPRYGNLIYKWDDKDEWKEFISLSFMNQTFYGDINKYYSEHLEYPFVLRKDFFVLKNFFILNFHLANKCCNYYFHNTFTKTAKSGKVKNDLIRDYERFFPISQSDNSLIESIEAKWVLDYFQGLNELNESLKDLQEDDNPVLVIYEFK
jgi:hypothetical protein